MGVVTFIEFQAPDGGVVFIVPDHVAAVCPAGWQHGVKDTSLLRTDAGDQTVRGTPQEVVAKLKYA